MATTRTCRHSCGMIFCSMNMLNRVNSRCLATSGRFFSRLNLILSGPGAVLLHDNRAIENSMIVKGGLGSLPSTTLYDGCVGTESGHTFLAKSNIHLSDFSTLSFGMEPLRMALATRHRVLMEVSAGSPSTNCRQYTFLLRFRVLLYLRSRALYFWKFAREPHLQKST